MESAKLLNLDQTLAAIEETQPGFSFEKAPIEDEIASKSAIYTGVGIKILSVFGGFLGTAFFLGFLSVAIMDSAAGCCIFGALFIITSLFVNRISKSILLDTSTVCIYLSGFVLIAIGADKLKLTDNEICLIIAAVSLIGVFISRSFVLTFLSVLIFNGSLITLIENHNVSNITHVVLAYIVAVFVLLTLFEHKVISAKNIPAALYNPVRSAFLFSLIAVLALYSEVWFYNQPISYIWVASIILIIAILAILNIVFDSIGVVKPEQKLGYFLLSILILLPEFFAPSILGALLIILISYQYGHRTGFTAGILAFIYFVSRFYYDLSFTLLVKSEILMLSGVLFIAAFLLVRKKLTN